MKNSTIVLLTLIMLAGLHAIVWAAPDTYIGDAAIYSALDTGSSRPKPHVLLLIDTSQATKNKASGLPYVYYPASGTTPASPIYPGTYAPWSVYLGDNQGNFNRVEIASSTDALEGITCSTAGGALIKSRLLASGTYSGSGSTSYPNLRGGACDTGPTGATYALGNYLNYLAGSSTAGTGTIVSNRYTCDIGKKISGQWTYTKVTDGCIGTFQYIGGTTITNSDASNEPGMGTDWNQYWLQKSGGCLVGASTYCGTSNSTPDPLPVPSADEWELAHPYSSSALFVGYTQREIIYNALTQVVNGARGAVKFAAMTYNPNNQGGLVIYNMADLSSDSAFNNFKAALPGQINNADGTKTYTGAAFINSTTNRPQAEALYDAGHYYKAKYPTTGTISSTAVFPLNSTSFTEGKISAAMDETYPSTNRNECGYNHVILITNGLSNGDGNAGTGPLAKIVDADGDARPIEAVYGGGSHYLDDVAAYLNKQEGITTHTVLAFQSADPLISGAANAGGGKFYNVFDANSLAEALTKLLTTIVLEADTSFVAPVVPASSTNRTISSNRVYLGLFKPQNNRPWLGNLKKYGVSSDLTLLDRAGAAATDINGDFYQNSKSFWGDDGSSEKRIMSIDGLLPLSSDGVSGDGGNVAAGGVGGSLIVNMRAALAGGSQAWQSRKIYTYPSGSASTTLTHADNRFSPTNTRITAATLAVTTETEKNQLVNYVAGADGFDENNNGNFTEIRDWVLGDILHSKPLIFSYKSFTAAQESSCTENKSMVYVGSNDGMFHAFRDCDGSEAWAFIPDNLLPNLKYLRLSDHYYFSDAPPTAYVHDVDGDNVVDIADGDKVILIFGQGRGGGRSTLDASGSRGAYYALDVTNPEAPALVFKIDNTTTGYGELGETWSSPRLAKVKIGTADKVVAFVGAGYDNNEDLRFGNNMLFPETTSTTNTTLPTNDSGDHSSSGSSDQVNPKGRGVYAVEIATLVKDGSNKYQPVLMSSGSLVWSFVSNSSNGMNYSIPSDLTVLDMNGDGYHDRIYVGDTGGRIWRFDTGSVATSDWTTSGRMIFKSNKDDESNKGRKIFYKPTVALVQGVPTLYFGTGDRVHPLNSAVTDRMFAVMDKGQTTAKDISKLADLTSNRLQATDATTTEITAILNTLASKDSSGVYDSDLNYGWYVNLYNLDGSDNTSAGEKVLAPALIFNKQAFYTTYTPLEDEDLDVCQVGNLGSSRLYQLDYATAEATYNYSTANDSNTTAYTNNVRTQSGDKVLQREDRVKDIGVGIPSGIVTLIDASGKVSLMISSSNRVGTYQAPSAKMMAPLYWIQY